MVYGEAAVEILRTARLATIAKEVCQKLHLGTMYEIGELTDAQIDALKYMLPKFTSLQNRKMKALRTACRQGDPSLMNSIWDNQIDYRAKTAEHTRQIEELEEQIKSESHKHRELQSLLAQLQKRVE